MVAEKVSLTLDEDVVAAARDVAGPRGLSGYVNHALRRQLQHDRVSALLKEMEATSGRIDPDVMQEVRRQWPADEDTARSA